MRGWPSNQGDPGGLGVYYDGMFWVDMYQEYNSASGDFAQNFINYT